jgi:hypothetical protein
MLAMKFSHYRLISRTNQTANRAANTPVCPCFENVETLPAFKTDANTKERPNIWKTKYDARTIPAGLNIHASLGWK